MFLIPAVAQEIVSLGHQGLTFKSLFLNKPRPDYIISTKTAPLSTSAEFSRNLSISSLIFLSNTASIIYHQQDYKQQQSENVFNQGNLLS